MTQRKGALPAKTGAGKRWCVLKAHIFTYLYDKVSAPNNFTLCQPRRFGLKDNTMNYRHAFHAGNFADIAKHLALIAILRHLKLKPKPFAVIDTHAGRGAYDLSDRAALCTGEAAAGIDRLRGKIETDSELLSLYLDLCATGPVYPGSPLITSLLLRPEDRLVALEKHPEEALGLREVLHAFLRARVVEGDGYVALPGLLPPPERRGLVLIDPPFEERDEFETCGKIFAKAYRRFATGTYMIWFPIKSWAEAERFGGEILSVGADNVLRFDIVLNTPLEERLGAAGLIIVNPPYGFEAQMRAALGPVLPRIDARIDCRWLAGHE